MNVLCPTVGCDNASAPTVVPELPVPGPVSRTEAPPTYCGVCGALMTEEES